MDHTGPSCLINDDVVMGESLDGEEVYGLSKLRHSGRIAKQVEKIGQQRWGSNHIAMHFVNNQEESDDEDIEDDEPMSDFDVNVDGALEGLEEDDEDIDINNDIDELVAAQGQEGISL